MNPNFIPVFDAANLAEAMATFAANHNGLPLDLGLSFAPLGMGQPMAFVPNITAMNVASGDEVYTFVMQESADSVSWTVAGPAVVRSAAAGSPVQAVCVPGWVSQRYIRMVLTVAGTAPSITYETDFATIGVGA